MRSQFIVLAASALLAVAACSGSSATAAPTAAPSAAAPSAAASSGGAPAGATAVAIKNFTFNPATVDVKAGAKVTWTNGDDTAHTVTFDDTTVGGSGNLNSGTTFDLTFPTAGSFAYHCKIHPSMKGTVTVS